jgi:hypothetical protein
MDLRRQWQGLGRVGEGRCPVPTAASCPAAVTAAPTAFDTVTTAATTFVTITPAYATVTLPASTAIIKDRVTAP